MKLCIFESIRFFVYQIAFLFRFNLNAMADKLETFSCSPILRPKSKPKRQKLDDEAVNQRKIVVNSRLNLVTQMANIEPSDLDATSTPTTEFNYLRLENSNQPDQGGLSPDLSQNSSQNSSQTGSSTPPISCQTLFRNSDKTHVWRGPVYVQNSHIDSAKKSQNSSVILKCFPVILSNLKQTADVIINDEIRYMGDFRTFTKTVFDRISINMIDQIDTEWHKIKLNEALNSKSVLKSVKNVQIRGNARGNVRGSQNLDKNQEHSDNNTETWGNENERPRNCLDILPYALPKTVKHRPGAVKRSDYLNFSTKWAKISQELNQYVNKYF